MRAYSVFYSANLLLTARQILRQMIKQLSQQTAQQLCAQQVITNLPDCVKQLVDNSIDAKATFIRVSLVEYGKSKLQVLDNGMGISDFDFIGKKGSTSKNRGFDRFDFLGFRGQAIHSIARVSGSMLIESKCVRDGYRRRFNAVTLSCEEFQEERICQGQFNFMNANLEGSRNTGTKITIEDLFAKLPVRQLELQGKCKDFLKKTNELIKEYCLIYPEIQFVLTNKRQGKEQTIIETAPHKLFDRASWLERISQLDERIAKVLIFVYTPFVQGYVLNKIESGSSRDNGFIKKNYHYLFINRRPVDPLPVFIANLNEIYKKYNNNTKYAFILNIKLEHQDIDLNLSPNKREVFIRKETLENIMEGLKKEIISKVVEDIPTLSNFQQQQQFKKGGQILNNPSRSSGFEQIPKIDQNNPRKTIFFPSRHQENSKQVLNIERIQIKAVSEQGTVSKGQELRKDGLTTKSVKLPYELPELPKININRDRLKEQLNSKMGAHFSGLRKTISQKIIPLQIPQKPILGSEAGDDQFIQEIRRRKQQNKIQQQQQDAKRRADFMKQIQEVKIQEDAQFKKPKMSTTSVKSKQYQPKGNLMEQELRSKRLDHQCEKPIDSKKYQENEEIGDNQQKEKVEPSKINNNQSELALRIQSKLNSDMSQIFTKFNQSKQLGYNKQLIPVCSNHENKQQNQQKDHQQSLKQIESIKPFNSLNKIQTIADQEGVETLKTCLISELGQLAPKNIKKEDFMNFQIIGQFNLGFIICAFKGRYYMVDQHAADEKFRYQKNLKKSKEPECINCFEEREIAPIENDEIEEAKKLLNEAGFYYSIIDRKLLKLQRCPVYNERKLGMEYFDIIVTEKKELQRVPKFTSMCAMMACREATKVGQVLSREQMCKEVSNLSRLASPWNCPHGRPTLIELGTIHAFKSKIAVTKQYYL